MASCPSHLSVNICRNMYLPVIINEGLPSEAEPWVPGVRTPQAADEGAASRCSYHSNELSGFHPAWSEGVKEVDLLQVLETLHPQEALQQWGSPRIIIMVELESEDLELASGASELLENFDPLAAALV